VRSAHVRAKSHAAHFAHAWLPSFVGVNQWPLIPATRSSARDTGYARYAKHRFVWNRREGRRNGSPSPQTAHLSRATARPLPFRPSSNALERTLPLIPTHLREDAATETCRARRSDRDTRVSLSSELRVACAVALKPSQALVRYYKRGDPDSRCRPVTYVHGTGVLPRVTPLSTSERTRRDRAQ
jgi:hypothetical protein